MLIVGSVASGEKLLSLFDSPWQSLSPKRIQERKINSRKNYLFNQGHRKPRTALSLLLPQSMGIEPNPRCFQSSSRVILKQGE